MGSTCRGVEAVSDDVHDRFDVCDLDEPPVDRLELIKARSRMADRRAGRSVNLTAEEVCDVRAALLAGADPAALAERLGVTVARIHRCTKGTAIVSPMDVLQAKREISERRALLVKFRRVCTVCGTGFGVDRKGSKQTTCSHRCAGSLGAAGGGG
jgi:hypothetical protein